MKAYGIAIPDPPRCASCGEAMALDCMLGQCFWFCEACPTPAGKAPIERPVAWDSQLGAQLRMRGCMTQRHPADN